MAGYISPYGLEYDTTNNQGNYNFFGYNNDDNNINMFDTSSQSSDGWSLWEQYGDYSTQPTREDIMQDSTYESSYGLEYDTSSENYDSSGSNWFNLTNAYKDDYADSSGWSLYQQYGIAKQSTKDIYREFKEFARRLPNEVNRVEFDKNNCVNKRNPASCQFGQRNAQNLLNDIQKYISFDQLKDLPKQYMQRIKGFMKTFLTNQYKLQSYNQMMKMTACELNENLCEGNMYDSFQSNNYQLS